MIRFLELIMDFLEKLIEFIGQFKTNKKYYVYNTRGREPQYIHESYNSALAEAKRIAKLEPFGKIQVLEIITSIDAEGIPF